MSELKETIRNTEPTFTEMVEFAVDFLSDVERVFFLKWPKQEE